MAVSISIFFSGQSAKDFKSFLVGTDQSPIGVEIHTSPPDASVIWRITPVGQHSGKVDVSEGTSKAFSFSPTFEMFSRPITGSNFKNDPVGYMLTVAAEHPVSGTAHTQVSISQDEIAILRQEYVDFGLSVPPLGSVGKSISTNNFNGKDFSEKSNYAPLVVNGGMQTIAQAVRDKYGRPIVINSAYRNPRRNRKVGGVLNSIHQTGGAIDMARSAADEAKLAHLVALYRAALSVAPGMVLLERNAIQLLPGNWAPPPASFTINHGGATITVVDSDGDDLPDTVSSIVGAPATGIPCETKFKYDGNGIVNPFFVIASKTGAKVVAVGDELQLIYQTGVNKPLKFYFQQASHVHADNRGKVADGGLQRRVQNQVSQSGIVRVDSGLVGTEHSSEVIKALTGRDAIIVENPQVSVTDDTVSVRGLASIIRPNPIPVSVDFSKFDSDETIINVNLFDADLKIADADDFLFDGAFISPRRLEALKMESLILMPADEAVTIIARGTEDIDVGGGFLLLRRPTLAINAVGLAGHVSTKISATLNATVDIASTKFVITGEFDATNFEMSRIAIEPSAGNFPSIADMVRHFLPVQLALPDGLRIESLFLNKFLNSESFLLSMIIAGDWKLPLGAVAPKINNVSIDISAEPSNVSARLMGYVDIFGTTLSIESDLETGMRLSGKLPKLCLNALIAELTGKENIIPKGLPNLELPKDSIINMDLGGDRPQVTVETVLNDGSKLILTIMKLGDAWEAAAVISFPPNWQLSRLSNKLSPLDFLVIESPLAAASTFSTERFTFRDSSGNETSVALKKGFVLSGNLALRRGGLELVAALTHIDRVPLQLAIAENVSDASIDASLGGPITLVPTVAEIQGFSLSFKPNPLQVKFSCIADVVIFNEKLPQFAIAVALVDNETRVLFKTNEPWASPFGISGLTVNKLVFQIDTSPVSSFAVLGDISISGKRIVVAAQFVSSAPTMLAGELDGKLSLKEVVKDLVGLTLPDMVEIAISDFKIRIVADPAGVVIGDERFEPGLALQGTLTFAKLSLFTKVVIDPGRGVFVQGELSERVNIGGVVVISDAEGSKPPSVTIDTSKAPFVAISAAITMFGLKESISSKIDESGFEFEIKRSIGIAQYELRCVVEPPKKFSANGKFEFGIDESIGPIQLTPGTPSLGKIAVRARINGQLDVSVVSSTFKAVINADFELQGSKFTVPKISLSAAPQDFDDFPARIRKEIIDKAQDIFADLFVDADKWLLALRDGVINAVENVAVVLKSIYAKDSQFIASSIQNTLGRGATAAADGLRSIQESAQQIAQTLNALGNSVDVVGDALTKVGFPDDQIKDAIDNVFGGGHWPPHAKLPHVKHIKLPHVKHVKVPHVKHVKLPHVKHVKLPHAKHLKLPHAKHIKLPHAKHVKIPHIKSPW